MHLLPDDDQRSIRDSAAELLLAAYGATRAHDLSNGRADPDPGTWAELAAMGWFGLALPEEDGGAGLTSVEEALVFTEAGRALAPVSVLATVLAAHTAHAAQRSDVLDDLLSGRRRAGLLVHDGARQIAIEPTAGGVVLQLADDRVGLYDLDGSKLAEAVDLIDPATTATACVPGEPIVEVAGDAARRLVSRASLLVAAYLSGIAAKMLADGVAYAKQRQAFGKPIGAFQGVKHRLATVAMDTEAADAQVAFASVCVGDELAGHEAEAQAAKVLALKAALSSAGACIQVHGALGVTWEFDAHLYLTRARILEHVPVSPRCSLEQLVRGGVA